MNRPSCAQLGASGFHDEPIERCRCYSTPLFSSVWRLAGTDYKSVRVCCVDINYTLYGNLAERPASQQFSGPNHPQPARLFHWCFAILTASVQRRLGKLLFQKLEGSETSIIEVVASTFLHFIVIQTLALTCAVLGLSQLGRNVGALLTAWGAGHFTMMTLHAASLAYRFVSFFLFAYALMLIVAAAVALFRTLGWEALVSEDEDRRGGGPGPSAK
jgi:hypothetical protein